MCVCEVANRGRVVASCVVRGDNLLWRIGNFNELSAKIDRDVAGLGPGPLFSGTLYRESGAVPGAAFNINSSTSTKPQRFCLFDIACTYSCE